MTIQIPKPIKLRFSFKLNSNYARLPHIYKYMKLESRVIDDMIRCYFSFETPGT